MNLPKIIFPESGNECVRAAAKMAEAQGICEAVWLCENDAAGGKTAEKYSVEIASEIRAENSAGAILSENNLTRAMRKLARGEVDGLIAGADFTSREVAQAARAIVGLAPATKTFCSLLALEFPPNSQNNFANKISPDNFANETPPNSFAGRTLILADGGVVKNPTAAQLADIILLTSDAARAILADEPRVACLSFSTFGSGGDDASIGKIRAAITFAKTQNPRLKIDGEMQLDAAVNPRIAAKKCPDSPVAGRANVLIAPDLNSGNILYKSLEQFAAARAFGPILLGFAKPLSDLSRGSTTADVLGTIKIVAAQIRENWRVKKSEKNSRNNSEKNPKNDSKFRGGKK